MRPMFILSGLAATVLMLSTCKSANPHRVSASWHLMLAHDLNGTVADGTTQNLVAAVRNGCELRVAWGNKRKTPPLRSVEHVADVSWITVRNGETVSAQIGDFIINLDALGDPSEEHPLRAQFGGTQQIIKWRATLQTDGSFDAVWFAPHSGEFIARRPQKHPMRWYSNCNPQQDKPLYSTLLEDNRGKSVS